MENGNMSVENIRSPSVPKMVSEFKYVGRSVVNKHTNSLVTIKYMTCLRYTV